MALLFVNACVRQGSRTLRLAMRLLSARGEPFEEAEIGAMSFPEADEAFLKRRDALIARRAFSDPLFAPARQFARADSIVVAAPYWDLSFPAALKRYIEQVNVLGVTFEYTPEGTPRGLCRAKDLTYVTTAGGAYVPEEFGFGYVKALAENFYGIRDVRLVMAKGLDIDGADEEAIMREQLEKIGRDARERWK